MSHQLCPSCQSANQLEFTAEMNIHFPGMKGLDIPTVCVFPTVLISVEADCCDFGEFVMLFVVILMIPSILVLAITMFDVCKARSTNRRPDSHESDYRE